MLFKFPSNYLFLIQLYCNFIAVSCFNNCKIEVYNNFIINLIKENSIKHKFSYVNFNNKNAMLNSFNSIFTFSDITTFQKSLKVIPIREQFIESEAKLSLKVVLISLLLQFQSVNAADILSDANITQLILPSDEIEVKIPVNSIKQTLGIALTEVKYKDNVLIQVKSIKPNAPEAISNSIYPGMILSVVGNNFVEGLSSNEVAKIVKQSIDGKRDEYYLNLIFRDPNIFLNTLNTSRYITNNDFENIPKVVSTRIPNLKRSNSILVIERTTLPKNSTSYHGSTFGDILEIEIRPLIPMSKTKITDVVKPLLLYVILGSKQISPTVNAIASSLKEKDQLLLPLLSTPGWDIGLRGMIPSETRKITYPIGFISDSRYSDKSACYYVTLRSINGEI